MNAFLAVITQTEADRISKYLNLEHAKPTVVGIIVFGLVALSFALSVLFAYVLLHTQTLPKPNALVSSLTLLTFIALLASIFTDSESLKTIAASGIGAIAGALTTAFRVTAEDEPTVVVRTSTRTRHKLRTQEMTQTPPAPPEDSEPPCDPEDPDCQEIPDHGVNTPEEKMYTTSAEDV